MTAADVDCGVFGRDDQESAADYLLTDYVEFEGQTASDANLEEDHEYHGYLDPEDERYYNEMQETLRRNRIINESPDVNDIMNESIVSLDDTSVEVGDRCEEATGYQEP